MSNELTILTEEVHELREIITKDKANRLNDSLFSKELAPHYMQLAGQLSKTEMIPKNYRGKPQDLFVAMALGYQIGLSVEQAIQAIALINGKPCLYGDDMLALCMNHPSFVDLIEKPIVSNTNQVIGYSCTVKRKNMADHEEKFDLNMAKKAGLLGKQGPWTQYPERMMQMRARGFALRNRFPDALKGIKSREEVEDYIEAEYSVVEEKGSRSDILKKDYLKKTGKLDDAKTTTENTNDEDKLCDKEAKADNLPPSVEKAGEEKNCPYHEIKRLIVEKAVTEDRLAKALSFYEAKEVDDLSPESAEDFLKKLNKL